MTNDYQDIWRGWRSLCFNFSYSFVVFPFFVTATLPQKKTFGIQLLLFWLICPFEKKISKNASGSFLLRSRLDLVGKALALETNETEYFINSETKIPALSISRFAIWYLLRSAVDLRSSFYHTSMVVFSFVSTVSKV